MNKNRSLFLILGLIILSALAINIVSAGFWNWDARDSLGDDPTSIILSIIVIGIIFAAMFEIIGMVFATSWVKFVIAAGISIAAFLLEVPAAISTWGLGAVATLGTIGAIIAIVVAVFAFLGTTKLSGLLKKISLSRKAQAEKAKAIERAGDINALEAEARAVRGGR